MKFLNDLDFFLFGSSEAEERDVVRESEEMVSLEDLMRVLGEEDEA
jgi:hypothetical protein